MHNVGVHFGGGGAGPLPHNLRQVPRRRRGRAPPPHNVGVYFGGGGAGPPPHNSGGYFGVGTGPAAHNVGKYVGAGGGAGPPPHNSGGYVPTTLRVSRRMHHSCHLEGRILVHVSWMCTSLFGT